MMKLEITVSDKTEDFLREIAEIHNCSVNMAAITVLERYGERTKKEIERAQNAADRSMKNND